MIVASSGNLSGLELTDDVRRMAGADLAAEILRVLRRAQAGLAEQAAEAVEETVGSDTEIGRAVLQSFAQRFPAESGEPGCAGDAGPAAVPKLPEPAHAAAPVAGQRLRKRPGQPSTLTLELPMWGATASVAVGAFSEGDGMS